MRACGPEHLGLLALTRILNDIAPFAGVTFLKALIMPVSIGAATVASSQAAERR